MSKPQKAEQVLRDFKKGRELKTAYIKELMKDPTLKEIPEVKKYKKKETVRELKQTGYIIAILSCIVLLLLLIAALGLKAGLGQEAHSHTYVRHVPGQDTTTYIREETVKEVDLPHGGRSDMEIIDRVFRGRQ
jgi:hypothetical protein